MDRRTYLTGLGAAVAAVSGCSEGNSTGTTTDTATGTASTTEQGTPTAEPDPTPSVTDAGLLLDRGEYATLGDIDSVGQGGLLIVGVEYEVPASGGNAQGLVEMRVFDDDTRLDTNTTEVNVVADGDSVGRRTWVAFDTADWEPGSYTAEVLVNSDSFGTTASTAVAFDIVEPLGPGEVEMFLADFPDDAVAREAFEWTLGFRNLADRDSSVVTDIVTVDPARADSVETETQYRENIPAGEETTVDKTLRLSIPGTYTYRIDAIDAEVDFTLSPPEE